MSRAVSACSRRRFIRGGAALAGCSVLAGCGLVPLPGERPVHLHRIGFLESGPATTPPTVQGFREGLRELGYVEGENVTIEYRDAGLHPELLPALATELTGLPVDVIVVSNVQTAIAASQATATIPIVAAGGNIVVAGLVTRVARPEANITGVATNSGELIGKWVELLKQAVPTVSRLAVVADRSNPASEPFLREVGRAAQTLHLEQAPYDVRDLDQLAGTLVRAKAAGADGLIIVSGGVFRGGNDARIGGQALQSRLPSVAEGREFAINGGLLALGANTSALARRSATYVDKILKGALPGDLPVELPTTFHVVVNLRAAEVLGLTIPPSVVQQATEVIQ